VTAQQFPLLRVSTMRTGDTAILRLDGELDCATAPGVEDALRGLLDGPEPPDRLIVDAELLTFVDVSGLDPLIRVGQELRSRGSLQLRNARGQIVRVIRLLELAEVFGLER
jgi:anti-anti-sigma factor